MVDTPLSSCTVCARSFAVKFRYQVREDAEGFSYFCSQMCQQKDVSEPARKSHSDVAPASSAPRTDVHVPRPQSVSSVVTWLPRQTNVVADFVSLSVEEGIP